ncbi:sulfate reduction electron transfer complex DsrMKJOP subunit DsrM [Desulfovermiculus halophilus]|jgi:nitrate reductase gamma subunit|uniref:sulfate reduction electron transfer complex DsrMKJOP subunit DsrM n=1 Tax=Desulfovermiculus halophilus TaxID=339722 RepID=UPI0004871116|nr:sulfate reduction electron transfer complex DsrMKJOP subunit DsrM [Desulfovermiculus halophilus]
MNVLYSLLLVLALVVIPLIGAGALGWHTLFGVFIPLFAVVVFLVGFVYRILDWGRSAVPFRIPTTGGQQETMPWIKQSKLDNPSTTAGTVGRMALEILLFRSLFRNTQTQLSQGPKLSYGSSKWLWLGAIAFHYSFFIIVARHMRFFTEPIPMPFEWLDKLDGILQIGVPTLYLTEIVILAALAYLFLRRVVVPQLRYISLPADYFPLFLILAIVISGILMRYFIRTDVMDIKTLTMGLATLNFSVPEGIGVIFYIHMFLVSALLVYFPMSKLMHLGGVFLSPTRNLANNNRMQRHINPWNHPVKVHTYQEWEDEYREQMKEAGLPVEKE